MNTNEIEYKIKDPETGTVIGTEIRRRTVVSIGQQNAQTVLDSVLSKPGMCDRKKVVKNAFLRATRAIEFTRMVSPQAQLVSPIAMRDFVIHCAAHMAMFESVDWRDVSCSCSSVDVADAINEIVLQNPVEDFIAADENEKISEAV